MIATPNIQAALRDRANFGVWELVGIGPPTSGTSGTGVGFAGTGSSYVDSISGFTYKNVGTMASPNWTSSSGAIGVSRATYNFAIDGGAIGAIIPSISPVIPANAIVFGGIINVITAPTGAGASIALGTSAGSSSTALKAATVIANYTGLVALVPVWSAGSSFKMSAAGQIQLTVSGAALTAGKMDILVEYLLGSG